MTDAADFSTDELIAALFSRFNHCGFIGGSYDDKEPSFIKRSWKGNPHMVAGLAHDLQDSVVQEHRENSRPL